MPKQCKMSFLHNFNLNKEHILKDYYEISVKINPSAIELVTDVFFAQFECEGVVQAEEKWKDLELIETTNNLAKGYVLIEPEDFSPVEIQKIFNEAKTNRKKPDLLTKNWVNGR